MASEAGEGCRTCESGCLTHCFTMPQQTQYQVEG